MLRWRATTKQAHCGPAMAASTARETSQLFGRIRLLYGGADGWKACCAVLGPRFGLVRVLFFDKPPEQTWALPWHRDLTIAVCNNRLPSTCFRKPTCKAGVPHIQAPRAILEAMLTLRVHLDEVTAENGPLRVVPGSHVDGCEQRAPATILAGAGDVLAMRPLLLHSSNRSHPETRRHRRVLHLEFAASPELPGGFAWHEFIAG